MPCRRRSRAGIRGPTTIGLPLTLMYVDALAATSRHPRRSLGSSRSGRPPESAPWPHKTKPAVTRVIFPENITIIYKNPSRADFGLFLGLKTHTPGFHRILARFSRYRQFLCVGAWILQFTARQLLFWFSSCNHFHAPIHAVLNTCFSHTFCNVA